MAISPLLLNSALAVSTEEVYKTYVSLSTPSCDWLTEDTKVLDFLEESNVNIGMSNLEVCLVVLNSLLLGALVVGALIVHVDGLARKALRGELEALKGEFQAILKRVSELTNANAETIVKLGDKVQRHEMVLSGVGKK